MMIKPIYKSAAILLLAAIWGHPVLADAAAPAPSLNVVYRARPTADILRDGIFRPFAASRHVLVRGLPVNRGRDWDVALVPAAESQAGCATGRFRKLDWSKLGGKQRYVGAAVSDCGAGAYLFAEGLAWDQDKLKSAPNWQDFWDVARNPGKRGLRREARGTLEIALMADGVSPTDVYRQLNTDAGVERAFRKLDQLKPYLVWWKTGADAVAMLKSGSVLMTSAPNTAIVAADHAGRHLSLQWSGSLGDIVDWVLSPTTPRVDTAYALLNFAATPESQAKLSNAALIGLVGASAQENLRDVLLLDDDFWHKRGDALEQRFNNWLNNK